MILKASDGIRGKVIDLDTNLEVRKVVWLDTDKGILEAEKVDATGRTFYGADGQPLTYKARGRFKFIDIKLKRPRNRFGALVCAKCPSTLTLQGEELCPTCKAKDRNQKHKMQVESIDSPLLEHRCEKCSRYATISVSDEVEVSPVICKVRITNGAATSDVNGPYKVAYERGQTVDRRFYCQWCYEPPRLLDPRGEIIKDL